MCFFVVCELNITLVIFIVNSFGYYFITIVIYALIDKRKPDTGSGWVEFVEMKIIVVYPNSDELKRIAQLVEVALKQDLLKIRRNYMN